MRVLGKLFITPPFCWPGVTLSCRPQQAVILSPGETDLVVLNRALSRPAITSRWLRPARLDTNFWAKILLVRYNDHPAAMPTAFGKRTAPFMAMIVSRFVPIPVYTRDARAIAIVLAQELAGHERVSFRRSRRVRRSQHAAVYNSRPENFEILRFVAPGFLLERHASGSMFDASKCSGSAD